MTWNQKTLGSWAQDVDYKVSRVYLTQYLFITIEENFLCTWEWDFLLANIYILSQVFEVQRLSATVFLLF